MKTQSKMILSHLEEGKAIDPHRALMLWGCMRLGARIYDLKKQGHRIVSKMATVKNRFGVPCRIAIYRMEK